MARFAQIDENGKVLKVIVADQDFINSGAVGDPSKWMECYKEGTKIDKAAFKGSYPGPGSVYDNKLDKFIKPQPYPSWYLDETDYEWKPPFDPPKSGGQYYWSEDSYDWVDEQTIKSEGNKLKNDY